MVKNYFQRLALIKFPTFCIWFILAIAVAFIHPPTASAQQCPADAVCRGGCTQAGQCATSGKVCGRSFDTTINPPIPVEVFQPTSTPCGGGTGQAVMGGVYVPWGVSRFNPDDASSGIGIINFASLLLRIFTIICGLWFMFNMIYAGYLFITSSGDTAVFNKFKESLFYSLLGLLIIATAYLIAGLIGAVFFGDPGFIIRPTLFQAGTP